MDFQEAISIASAEDAAISRRRVAVDRLRGDSRSLSAEDCEYRLTPGGLTALCGHLGRRPKVPAAYVASLPEKFRADLLRHHLAERYGRHGQFILLTRGADLVGVARADLVHLSCREALESVRAGFEGSGDPQIARLEIVDGVLRADVVVSRASREVRPGDVVLAGVRVTHPVTSEAATKIEGYLHRLVCTNGAVHRECVGARKLPRTRRLPADHPRAEAQQRDQIRRMTSAAFEGVGRRLDDLTNLAKEPVDFEELATTWIARTRLSYRTLMPLLRRAYAAEEGGGTAFDVLNAFTRLATHHDELPRATRDVLSRLGGLLALGHSRLCSRCWSLVAERN